MGGSLTGQAVTWSLLLEVSGLGTAPGIQHISDSDAFGVQWSGHARTAPITCKEQLVYLLIFASPTTKQEGQ